MTNGRNPRKKNRNGNQKQASSSRCHLSPCALAYAKAKLDPFNYGGNELPCIPDIVDIPSYKFATMYRGAFAVGTGNIGFVQVAPLSCANDIDYIAVTGSAFTGTALVNTATTGVTFLTDPKFPYASTQARTTRVVACGLRVRYTGTELNRGGSLCFFANNNRSNYNGMSYAQVTNLPGAYVMPCTRTWSSIIWNSAIYTDYQYNTNNASPNANPFLYSLLCLATGTTANTYEFEVVRYIEMIEAGPDRPVPSVTMSHSDPVGLGIVKDFLSDRTVQDLGKGALSSFYNFVKDGAAAYASTYFGPAGPALKLLTM